MLGVGSKSAHHLCFVYSVAVMPYKSSCGLQRHVCLRTRVSMLAGMLVQPANLERAGQEALLASAFPQLPDAFRGEVARQTCAGSQAVSAFGHICQARLRPGPPVSKVGMLMT